MEGKTLCTGITEVSDRWELLAFGDQRYSASRGVSASLFSLAFPSPGVRGQNGRAAVTQSARNFEPLCFMLNQSLFSLIKKLLSVID